MAWLIEYSMRMRLAVLALATVLVFVGLRAVREVPLDVFPEFAPPLVEIQTEAPGFSSEDVESLITVPIENAVNGVPFLETIRSKSVLGLSSVRMIFRRGQDVLQARQLVQERLAIATTRLPTTARAPVILPPLSSLSRCLKIGVWSETASQMDMTVLARWTIRPRLMAVSGVANVAIWGEKDPQLHIVVDPERLRASGVTLNQVLQAGRDATAIGGGGFLDTGNQRLAIRQEPTKYSPDALGEVVVAFRGNAPVRVKDVARVVVDHAPPIGDAVINNQMGLLLIVEKQPWANTLDVTQRVEQAMEELRPALGEVEFDTTIFRPATFIERALHNLSHSMLVGCVLVSIVLLAFLYDWRTAVISVTAIPLSLLASILVLSWLGETVNTMVLAGLVIALGEVVDDAIIDVENIVRRLRLNAQAAVPRGAFEVVLQASLEVRSAVVYATVIVILAFSPVLFLTGLAGSFFRPLAMAYVTSILASLAVALIVTPAMAYLMLPQIAERTSSESPLTRYLRSVYRRLLPPLVNRPLLTLGGAAIGFAALASLVPLLGEELLPRFKETDFLMHWVEKPGIGIDAMNRITLRASEEMLAVDGVRNFGSHIGRAEVADEVVGPNFTELWISIDEKLDYDTTVANVQEIVDGYPGLYRDLLTYLTERIKEVLSGASGSIVVRTYGSDLQELRDTAQRIAKVMEQVDGASAVHIETQVLVPQVQILLRPDAANRFGMTAAATMRSVTTLVNGALVGEIYDRQEVHGVVVRGEKSLYPDVIALRRLMLDTPTGGQVSLGDIADVSIVPAANAIQRENASRRIDVTCNASGRDLGSVAHEVEKRVLGEVDFKTGYHPEFLGEFAEAEASRRQILMVSCFALMAILVVLYSDFQSWRLVLLMVVPLPLALLGGVVGAHTAGGVISLGSLVGFVTVLGIAARNGIMLISHYRHLQTAEGFTDLNELVVRGAEERLAPILMTGLTTGLALLPLIVSGNIPGQEIEYPMAQVIIGGLISASLLNLFVLPVAYRIFGNCDS